MKDPECVRFLQWALPQLRMRWPGYRRVRRQVCKRITRRMQALGLPGPAHYRDYLQARPQEWSTLDSLCRVTISRFYRDRVVFDRVFESVVPHLLELVQARGADHLHACSIGCASGEEPYTLAIGLSLGTKPLPENLPLDIIASDVDPVVLARAQVACYQHSSISELRPNWLMHAFEHANHDYCLRARYRKPVRFLQQDVRTALPQGPFDIVLCRNLVFTYFNADLQSTILEKLLVRLQPGSAVVIGKHESLPAGCPGLEPWFPELGIYRREPH